MKFANIEMLLWIWALPVLAFVFWRGMHKRRRILAAYASFKGRRAIVAHVQTSRRWLKAALMLGAVLCLAIAMAGPQNGYKWQEIERKGIDIIIALDCSKSMLAADIKPSRLDRAKREIFDLLSLLEGDRAGLVAFAGTAFLQCPLTLDYDAFHLFLNALTPDFLPLGGTDLAAAIDTAVSGFDPQTHSEKAVILITDGESTRGDPFKAAEAATKAGIKLFCIGVGNAEGIPIPDAGGGFKKDAVGNIILTRIDEELLKKIAVLSGGTYVRSVAGDMDLDVIYTKEIKGKMQAATLSGGRKKVWEDRYQWFLGLAIVCLMIELFLPSTRKVIPLMMLLTVLVSGSLPAHAGILSESLQKGLEAYEEGDHETALNAFIQAQLDDPERSEIYYNLGNAYYKLGKYDTARSHYQKALTSEKTDLKQKTHYNLGNTDFRSGKLKEALTQYEAALKLDPDDQQVKSNIEFVKKVMEQQQEQQKQSSQGGETSKEDSGEKQGPQNHNPSAQSEEEQKPNEEGADSQDSETEQEHSAQRQAGEDGRPEAARDEDQKPGGSEAPPPPKEDQTINDQMGGDEHHSQARSQSPAEAGDEKQSARMLNRLKDKPGRAMIPFYQKRMVEKDW